MIKRSLSFDFSHKVGKIKPLNGANLCVRASDESFLLVNDAIRELSASVVRVGIDGYGGSVLDVHNIFPDFSLDDGMALSYNFTEADKILLALKESGAEILLTLGESPERYVKRYTNPPHDYDKYARILTRIISHYNDAWAGGYKLGIKFVQIFTDTDKIGYWNGSRDEYFRLYRTCALKIKERFPRIKVGAYSSGGFRSLNHVGMSEQIKGYVPYLEDFLSYISAKNTEAPLDFFCWDCYAETPEELALHTSYSRSYLNHYGFKRALNVITRFNAFDNGKGILFKRREYPSMLAASLITAEKVGIDMMLYSDFDPYSTGNALFSLDDRIALRRYSSFRVVKAFGEIIRARSSMIQSGEDYRHELYSLGALGEDGSRFILLATADYNGVVELNVGADCCSSYSIEGILGGGERGEGFVSSAEGRIVNGKIVLRIGKNEVYFISLR